MAFEAILDNKLIISQTYTDEQWLALQVQAQTKAITIFSPICHHPVYMVRETQRTRKHFAHYPTDASCAYATSEESIEHYLLKHIIADIAKGLGHKAKVEKSLGKEVRNDVSIWAHDKHYALEVQLSNQTHASYVIRTNRRSNKNVETIWLTTAKENLTILDVTAYYMTGIYTNKYTIFSNTSLTEQEYSTILRNSIHVEVYLPETDSYEMISLEEFLKKILETNNSKKHFTHTKPRIEEPTVSEPVSEPYVFVNDVIPFYGNLNCSCIKHASVSNYENMSQNEAGRMRSIEEALVKTFGENWCHREDKNPMLRLASDEKGVHRTVEEMLKYKYITL